MRRWGNVLGRYIINQLVPCRNGVVHWLEGSYSHFEWVASLNITLDGKIEGPLLIQRPGGDDNEEMELRFTRLGTCKERLRVAFISRNVDNTFKYLGCALKVWELDETACCWALVHNAPLEMQVNDILMLLAIHPTNPNVVFLVLDGFHILRYDMSSCAAQKVGHLAGRLLRPATAFF